MNEGPDGLSDLKQSLQALNGRQTMAEAISLPQNGRLEIQ